ncbi:hypothetical protein DW757_11355 [Clostridium sp. AM29-11AC]|nr:hypothetical protein DW757_11355 [Clostridium sp. AM29-11AC]
MLLLYHILRIWQPPAEFSARLSAVNAETGMRRYNARPAVIISYPSDIYLSEGCALAAGVFWLPSGASGSAQI